MVNYQKKQYVTQLKKEYNYISNGLKTYMANETAENLSDTTLWSDLRKGDIEGVVGEFNKIFKVSNFYLEELPAEYQIQYKGLNGEDWDSEIESVVVLADGSYIVPLIFPTPRYASGCNNGANCKSLKEFQELKQTPTKLYSTVWYLFIDVNGTKGPNILGRDAFMFYVGNDGVLYPPGSIDHAVFQGESYSDIANGNTHVWQTTTGTFGCTPDTVGYGCAGRIVDEGWEMKY